MSVALQSRLTNSDVVANCNDVYFGVEKREDFQLIEEIFINREYNIVSANSICAIDIGMNIGLASLYFSWLPNVAEVHSFEPFMAPFTRALKNFSRNQYFNKEIVPYNVGLSDENKELAVYVDPTTSIGTSIKGLDTGEKEVIKIRDAREVLDPIIRVAVKKNRGVFIKIDCEGSEFAIFEALNGSGLFRYVTAVAVEWHKWWDSRKTQHDLFSALFENDFFVFDMTSVSNPHAGLFYGVRKVGSVDGRAAVPSECRIWRTLQGIARSRIGDLWHRNAR